MATALQSLVSLALIFFLVFILFNQYRIDRLRQQLFIIRDSLFDEAAAGNISFDSSAYVYTRTVLNGFLRFSHRISVSRFLTAILLMKKGDLAGTRDTLHLAMSKSLPADRIICEKYLKNAHLVVLKHLGWSPFSVILFLPVISLVLTWACSVSLVGWFVTHCKTQLIRLDIAAYAEGRASAANSRDQSNNRNNRYA